MEKLVIALEIKKSFPALQPNASRLQAQNRFYSCRNHCRDIAIEITGSHEIFTFSDGSEIGFDSFYRRFWVYSFWVTGSFENYSISARIDDKDIIQFELFSAMRSQAGFSRVLCATRKRAFSDFSDLLESENACLEVIKLVFPALIKRGLNNA